MSDLPFDYPDVTPPNPAASARSCRHPRSHRTPEYTHAAMGEQVKAGERCRCGYLITLEKIRRTKSAIRAGKNAERRIAKGYPGGVRAGQYGGKDDVNVGERFAVQSKEWASQPSLNEVRRILDSMSAIPRTPVVVIGVPGEPRRALAIWWLADHQGEHGDDGLRAPEAP